LHIIKNKFHTENRVARNNCCIWSYC